MTNDEKIMQQALDALEAKQWFMDRLMDLMEYPMPRKPSASIEALRARLAQPEPLPKKSKGALSHKENERHNKMIMDKVNAINARLYEQPEPDQVDKGPWKAGFNRGEPRQVYVESDDFEHDVRLYVNGDFGTAESMLDYARGIARMLNAFKLPAESKPAPVAWMHKHDDEIVEFNDFKACPECEPLYAAPTQRKEWQGLTDEEILEAARDECSEMRWPSTALYIARATEAALKAKNA